MRERYYIYKITNLLTNENYIGQKKLKEGKNPLTDNYLGSGKIITEKIKEYGKENFSKDILKDYLTGEEADFWETKYIKEYKEKGEAKYNIAEGGQGNSLKYSNEDFMKYYSDLQSSNGKKYWDNLSKEEKLKRCQKMSEGWKSKSKEEMDSFKKMRSDKAKKQMDLMTNEEKEKINIKRSNSLKKMWANRTEEEQKNISNNISNSLKKRNNENREKGILVSVNGKPFKIKNNITNEIIKGESLTLWCIKTFGKKDADFYRKSLLKGRLEDYSLLEIDNKPVFPGSNYSYDGLLFKSSYTLAFYVYFTLKKTKIEYLPDISIPYIDEKGRNHNINIDFIISDRKYKFISKSFFDNENKPYNRYTKEYWYNKYNALKENEVIILREENFKNIFDYIKEKKGKNFLKECKI